MKNKDNYILLIIISIILLSILGIMFFDEDNNTLILNKEPVYKLVDDYSRFFTVESCVYKYITYLNSNKPQDILNVLDKDYIRDNNITLDNIYNFVDKLDGIYTFKAKKIYYEVDKSDVIKYYVYGDLLLEEMDSNGIKQDYYLKVNLDTKNQLFSVSPYDGSLFKEEG